jgi:hypothetical protein
MRAENVAAETPLAAPVLHPESEPVRDARLRASQPAPSAEEEEDDDFSLRGVLALDRPRKVLFSMVVELRTAKLRRWTPSMDFDRPRDLTDDE